jgi:hypothetical protein
MGCDGTWELLTTENICKEIDEMNNNSIPLKNVVE